MIKVKYQKRKIISSISKDAREVTLDPDLRNLSILAFLWPDLGFVPELGMSFSRQQNGHLYDIYLFLMLIA